jgi:PrsW family intramembrane metalloprotease
MLSSLLSIIFIVFFSLVPLLIWNYGSLYLRDDSWNRGRFFAGILWWAISVGVIFLFEKWLRDTGYMQIYAVISVFVILGGMTWIVTLYGSSYIRGFLRRILLLHIALFSLLLYGWQWGSGYLPMTSETLSFIAGISGFFVAACLEEWVKHVSTIALSSRDFRFSRRDLLLFTLFVTLGFVMIENLVYFLSVYKNGSLSIVTTGLYRLFFALPLHVLAASICVMLWWKALSYGVSSWRYVFFFTLGFFVAILVHSTYNFLIQRESSVLLLFAAICAYIAFTQWIIPSIEKEQSTDL